MNMPVLKWDPTEYLKIKALGDSLGSSEDIESLAEAHARGNRKRKESFLAGYYAASIRAISGEAGQS